MSVYTACRVEKKLGQKEKGKRRWSFQGKGKQGISIHPGPGELVLQGLHPLEVQNLPANYSRKGIRVNDLNMVLKQAELCTFGVDGLVMHGRLPLLHRECPLSC